MGADSGPVVLTLIRWLLTANRRCCQQTNETDNNSIDSEPLVMPANRYYYWCCQGGWRKAVIMQARPIPGMIPSWVESMAEYHCNHSYTSINETRGSLTIAIRNLITLNWCGAWEWLHLTSLGLVTRINSLTTATHKQGARIPPITITHYNCNMSVASAWQYSWRNSVAS